MTNAYFTCSPSELTTEEVTDTELRVSVVLMEESMESRAKLLGHPIHPMLVVLPLGLFIGAVVFDAVYLWRGSSTVATVGYWNIAGGIVGGLLAAVFGLIDWLAIPAGTRAKSIGLWHAGSNVLAILGFAFVWWSRYSSGQLAITSGLFAIEVVALLVGGVGGWLGGELVDRLGVGVDNGANLDAPNSMSGKRPRAA
jgi:uncharacterized membrane protein